MTDSWARPTDGDRRPPVPADDVIEITLAGPDGLEAPARPDDLTLDDDQPEPATDDQPNWRRIVGISSVLGVIVGVIVAVVVLGGGDDDDADPATTTLAPDEASTRITTPPTLPPVDEVDEAFAGQDSPGTGAGAGGDSAPVSVPDYPPVLAERWGVAASDFPLDLPTLPIDRPVISLLTISRFGESFGGPAVYDPATDRFQLQLQDGGGRQELLIDLRTEEILLAFSDDENPPQRWNRATDEIFGPTDDFTLREYVTALLLGPIRSDNIAGATSIDGDELVLLDESTAARRRDVVVPIGAVPEWDLLYGTGQGNETAGELEFELYISQDGATYVTQGVNDTGGELIATVHRVRIGDDRFELVWPSEDLIDDFPAFDDTPDTPPAGVTLQELTPTYPPAEEVLDDPPDFDLTGAIEQLRAATPPAYTVWERGPRGVSEISIRRDDANDRLAYTREVVEVRGDLEPFDDYFAQIDDRTTGTGFLRRGPDDPWTSVTLGGGVAPIDPRWSVGLVSADELAAAVPIGAAPTPVVLDSGLVVQPFALQLPPDTIQWDDRLVGGVSTTNPVDLTVFVGTDGLVHEIQVVANFGLPRVYVQRFDHSQLAITVDLP